jgi:hypothetical protein
MRYPVYVLIGYGLGMSQIRAKKQSVSVQGETISENRCTCKNSSKNSSPHYERFTVILHFVERKETHTWLVGLYYIGSQTPIPSCR